MILYIKGFYGYKNRGDEFLLFGLLDFLWKKYRFSKCIIESGDPCFLREYIFQSKSVIKRKYTDLIICVYPKKIHYKRRNMMYVFGGGELFSDERPFPYNGRNYFLSFFLIFMTGSFVLLGGFGKEKTIFTRILYFLSFLRAKEIIARDKESYDIVRKYKTICTPILYHDFAYDTLRVVFDCKKNVKKMSNSIKIMTKKGNKNKKSDDYIIININVYLQNEFVLDRCRQIVKKFPNCRYYFFSAAIGSDDNMVGYVKKHIPQILIYRRDKHSLLKNIIFFANAKFVFAARLHVLLLARYFHVPFEAFRYQEKIDKFLGSGWECDYVSSGMGFIGK